MSTIHHDTVIAPIRPANSAEGDAASVITIHETGEEAQSKLRISHVPYVLAIDGHPKDQI